MVKQRQMFSEEEKNNNKIIINRLRYYKIYFNHDH